MSPAVDITGDSIENNAIIINEEDDFLAVTHKASGTRLLVDRNTDLSDLWDAFDQGIETSEFWQDDGSGIAELLSQYNGINTPSVKTDSIDSDGDLNIQSDSDLNQNDIKNAGSVEADTTQTDNVSPNNETTVELSDVHPIQDYIFGGDKMGDSTSDRKIQAIGQGTSGTQTYEICTLSGTHDAVEITFVGHELNTSSSTRDAYIKWVVFPASVAASDNYRLEKIHDFGGGGRAPTLSVDQSTGQVDITKNTGLDTGWLKIETYGAEVVA